jgi:hypothetical protein
LDRIRELKCAAVTAYDLAGQTVASLAAQVTDDHIALAHRLPELTEDAARRRSLLADKKATSGAAERAAQTRANIERSIVELEERSKAHAGKAATLTQAQAAVDSATQALASSSDSSCSWATEQAEIARLKAELARLENEDKVIEAAQAKIVSTGKSASDFLAAVKAGKPPVCPIGGMPCPTVITCPDCGKQNPGLLADYYEIMEAGLVSSRKEWSALAVERKKIAAAMVQFRAEFAGAESRLNDRIAKATEFVREHEQRKAKLAAAKAELASVQAAAQAKANADKDLAQRRSELAALPNVTVASEEETEAMKVALAKVEADLSEAVKAKAAVDSMHSPIQEEAGKVKTFWIEANDKAIAANLAWYQALCGTFLEEMTKSLAALGVVNKDGVAGTAYIDLGADRLALGVDFAGVKVDAELLSGSEFTRFAWAVATASQDRVLVLGELETMADDTMEIAFKWLDSKPDLRCVLATCHGDPSKPLRERFPYVGETWQIAEVGTAA